MTYFNVNTKYLNHLFFHEKMKEDKNQKNNIKSVSFTYKYCTHYY